jgi:cytochrome b pre-mRNA-processing protein 3
MLLKRLFSRTPRTNPVRSVYEAIVALARQPVLYTDLAVPDTLDGRFDMIILHADAVVAHMQAGGDDDQEFAQNLIDEVFRDMDRSLREMGVGDMGVGKRVKKMATVYYGRADAYARARSQGGDDLADAILRNVYASNEVRAQEAARLAGYDRSLREAVATADRQAIRSGKLDLPPLAALAG